MCISLYSDLKKMVLVIHSTAILTVGALEGRVLMHFFSSAIEGRFHEWVDN